MNLFLEKSASVDGSNVFYFSVGIAFLRAMDGADEDWPRPIPTALGGAFLRGGGGLAAANPYPVWPSAIAAAIAAAIAIAIAIAIRHRHPPSPSPPPLSPSAVAATATIAIANRHRRRHHRHPPSPPPPPPPTPMIVVRGCHAHAHAHAHRPRTLRAPAMFCRGGESAIFALSIMLRPVVMKSLLKVQHLPVVAAVLFFGLVGLAFVSFPHPFSLIDTNISRLGRPSMNPDGHHWLLIALFATNVPLFAFYATLRRWALGQPTFDRVLRLVTVLSYFNGVALLLLAIFNADLRIPHRVFGGMHFIGSAIAMLLACWLILRHPKMDKALVLPCLGSAAGGLIFLASSGTASWAEWTSVVLSYVVAIWLGMNARRLDDGRA